MENITVDQTQAHNALKIDSAKRQKAKYEKQAKKKKKVKAYI